MRLYRFTFTLIAVLAFSFSCSKKDHEVQPSSNCRFIGKSYTTKQISYSDTTTYIYESHLKHDNEGKLTSITVENNVQNSSPDFPTKSSEDETFAFKYNADGFLTEISRRKLTLQQGLFSYNDYPFYKKGSIEINDITTFIYNGNLVQSSSNKISTIVQGDNYAPKTYKTELTKNYKYDPQGLVQAIEQKTEQGPGATIQFKNGILVVADTENTKYDSKGRLIKTSYGESELVVEYDANDNLIFVESHYQSKLVYSERRLYDNKKNPELLIPRRYKGIPDNVNIFLASSEQNNMVKKTLTYPDREPYIENTVWQYNPNGLPETSTLTVDYPGNKVTWITKFNYENCN
ncbi:hypothetical protein [Dyadobacter sp. CY326]|uniref:hypothetical protein n=1 Tax=Dyadobacter sp. CY326 TaxID=2907300 RepID=UPI001F448BA7|nr:hypothetical protein [Dyadobacter sp. CY326]MCE7066360.1 hypothetical protein [Dyadobacter sp. CY326]